MWAAPLLLLLGTCLICGGAMADERRRYRAPMTLEDDE